MPTTVVRSVSDVARLVRPVAESRAVVVGISGFGGAGKSTLAARLQEQLPGSVVIPGDEFLLERPPRSRSDHWSVVDRDRLRQQVLEPARRGAQVGFQVWDPAAQRLGPWVRLDQPTVIIVEALGLYVPELIELFDLRVWIDVDLDTATRRGMWRDEHVYGNPQTELWLQVWKPNDADFFTRFRPDRLADVLLSTVDEPPTT